MCARKLFLASCLLMLASPVFAVRHLMTISEVFTGLGGDTSVQYLELRVISFGQVRGSPAGLLAPWKSTIRRDSAADRRIAW